MGASNTRLIELIRASEDKPLTLDYELNDPADPENVYTRSDHYSYSANGIPIVFFTTVSRKLSSGNDRVSRRGAATRAGEGAQLLTHNAFKAELLQRSVFRTLEHVGGRV